MMAMSYQTENISIKIEMISEVKILELKSKIIKKYYRGAQEYI